MCVPGRSGIQTDMPFVLNVDAACPELLLINVASGFPGQQNIGTAPGFPEPHSWEYLASMEPRIFKFGSSFGD